MGTSAPAGAAVGTDSWESEPGSAWDPVVVDRVVRRVLGSPKPPEVIGHLGESFVGVVVEPQRQARGELVAEEVRVLLTRGDQMKHTLIQVERELSRLQVGEAMEEL